MRDDSNKWFNTGSRQIKNGRKISLPPEQYEVCRRREQNCPFQESMLIPKIMEYNVHMLW
jgi:hypothetical protein